MISKKIITNIKKSFFKILTNSDFFRVFLDLIIEINLISTSLILYYIKSNI